MKSQHISNLILFTSILYFLLPISVLSKDRAFVREYTYRASEADSKISARAIAIGQVKQLLLEEVGSFVHSTFIVKHEEKEVFKEMSTSQIKSITAGISRTTIVEEKWNGEEYYLRAKMMIDEDFLKKQLEEIARNEDQMTALEALQKKTDSAFAEIERLRLQLEKASDEQEKQELQQQYVRMSRNFTANTLKNDIPRIEVVFVLDATGSMGSMIANAKDKIWAIATAMAQSDPAPELSIGLIAFRDRTDAYITRQLPLTNNIDELYTQLLDINAVGGGDFPESVNQALSEVVFDFQWDTSPNTLRTIYLVGDSPPHMDYTNDIKYQKTCMSAAKKDIIINTIQCGSNKLTTQVWQEIAQYTNGEYLRLNQSGNSLAVTTPFDTELAKKARELDKTRVYYGTKATSTNSYKSQLSDEIYDKGKVEEVARRGVFNVTTDAGRKSFLGDDELIEAFDEGIIEVEEIDEASLPAEMKEMSTTEKKSHLKSKSAKRKELENEIRDLSEKRNKYIEQELDKRGDEAKDSFNNRIHNVFKKQAASKNYVAPSKATY